MIDVHCHLNFHSFQEDYDEVIKIAFEKGLTKIINTGTQISSSRQAIELADKYEHLYAIVGVHPHHADKLPRLTSLAQDETSNIEILQHGGSTSPVILAESRISIGHQGNNNYTDSGLTPLARMTKKKEGKKWETEKKRADSDPDLPTDWISQLEQMTQHPKVVGIGECGMDFYAYASNGIVDPKLQEKVFEEQIKLSGRSGLPLQIHNRQAGDAVIRLLEKNKEHLNPIPGMFHCFAGSYEVLNAALQKGFYIGFDGNITYSGIAKGETTDLKEIAKRTPLDRIVIETDSPYLTPNPHRGTRNEPQYAILVGEFIADLKGISYTDLVAQTTKNVYTIFTKLQH